VNVQVAKIGGRGDMWLGCLGIILLVGGFLALMGSVLGAAFGIVGAVIHAIFSVIGGILRFIFR